MSDDCLTPQQDWQGVFVKYESKEYRGECEGCGRGYHGNRWDAHHILPGVVFGQVTDPFIHECLRSTDFDINKDYAMGGLPKLTAFILFFQEDSTMPYIHDREQTVTMRRWGTVKQYANQATKRVEFPGNLPVHNPCNWGHLNYSDEVASRLKANIWSKLAKLKEKGKHPRPEAIKQMLLNEVEYFWSELEAIGKGLGGGGFSGVEANLRNRYDKATDGWWKPLCMSRKVTSAPSSPSIS